MAYEQSELFVLNRFVSVIEWILAFNQGGRKYSHKKVEGSFFFCPG